MAEVDRLALKSAFEQIAKLARRVNNRLHISTRVTQRQEHTKNATRLCEQQTASCWSELAYRLLPPDATHFHSLGLVVLTTQASAE
jgi:hypothetical protein